jgi:hypothetical protein
VKADGAVIPVVDHGASAGGLPSELAHINAFDRSRYGGTWADGLADEVVTCLWGARRIRKVFLSYCRKDSAGVAEQLFGALARLGYEVFLDEASIGHGAAFEHELEWWLNDADCLVLLASPSVPASVYVQKEISFARQYGVGLLAVAWDPPPPIVKTLYADEVVQLQAPDFSGAAGPSLRLVAGALEKTIAMVQRRRAVSVWRRLCNVLPYADQMLRQRFKHTAIRDGARLGDLEGDAQAPGFGNIERHYIRTLPHRPTIDGLFAFGEQVTTWVNRGTLRAQPDRLMTMYAESAPNDRRAKALRAFVEHDTNTLRFNYTVDML